MLPYFHCSLAVDDGGLGEVNGTYFGSVCFLEVFSLSRLSSFAYPHLSFLTKDEVRGTEPHSLGRADRASPAFPPPLVLQNQSSCKLLVAGDVLSGLAGVQGEVKESHPAVARALCHHQPLRALNPDFLVTAISINTSQPAGEGTCITGLRCIA